MKEALTETVTSSNVTNNNVLTLLKTRIALLWVFIGMVLVSRSMIAGFGELTSGNGSQQLSPLMQVWGSGGTLVIFALPIVCVTLKRDSWNRWLNIILGIAFTVAGIAGTGGELTHNFSASDTSFYLLDTAATIAPALITFYAYFWPRATRKSKYVLPPVALAAAK